MDVKEFVLSYYGNALENFHIKEIRKPDAALTLHSHPYFQIYYIRRGRITHHLESATAELTEGDVFLIPPGMPHYIEAAEGELCFYSISFSRDFLTGLLEGNAFVADFVQYIESADVERILPAVVLSSDDVMFCDQLVTRIMKQFTERRAGMEPLIKAELALLLTVFAGTYFDQKAESLRLHADRDRILHCLGYMESHLSDRITLADMAKSTAMSRTAFCRAFQNVVGEPFKKHLNRKRIEKAAALIRAGGKITAAAVSAGFSDFSTFSRNFKRIIGMCPSEYHLWCKQSGDEAHPRDALP